MKVKENIEKAGLKLKIQKMKIMACGPITSWQIDGETMEAVRDFSFLGSRITVDGDCKYEIKRHLLLGRKALTNVNSILKNREREQDGGGGHGVHLAPQIHQEFTFRHRSACRTTAESGQEYLTSGKECIEPHKTL